jgi:simple sugar transport system ATP-binding protein
VPTSKPLIARPTTFAPQPKREGVSAVFITHNLYHAYESCDRFTILSRGRVIRSLTKAETSIAELNEIIVKN